MPLRGNYSIMGMRMRALARAKINLTLQVLGKRDDGYHALKSLVVFAEAGDMVRVQPADTLSLKIEGPFASMLPVTDDNLVLRAARALDPKRGAAITLQKNLPVASGMGGGSADAAATLRLLNAFWKMNMPTSLLEDIALTLGSDVPVCLRGGALWMEGRGEKLTPAQGVPALHAVLVNPGTEVSTKDVFARHRKASSHHSPFKHDDFLQWLSKQSNDLQPAAIALCPVIVEVLAALDEHGARLARMSGSGATCFGVFESAKEARAAASTISLARPDWWVMATAFNGIPWPM